jgi:hypothetical protein
MKAAASNPEAVRRDRREKLRRERSASQPLRAAYPQVVQVRVQLLFRDGTPLPPAAQSHILHPPAPAFFRFPCPFSDCDGEFELGQPISQMVTDARRKISRTFECQGVRARHRLTGQTCGLHLDVEVAVSYAREAAA